MEPAENIRDKLKENLKLPEQKLKDDKPVQKITIINKITKTGIIASLDEFAQNSTLHGLRFIVDRTLNYTEKFFWFIVVIASIAFCGFLIQDLWIKWQNSSIIITMDNKLVPVSSINYPSLTICPQIKIKENSFDFEAANEYYKELLWSKMSQKSLSQHAKKFADLTMVCDDDVSKTIMHTLMKNYTVNTDNIVEEALDYENVFQWCQWFRNAPKCESLFQKVLIRDGVCYTINAVDANKIIRSENVVNKLFISKKNGKKYVMAPMRGSTNDVSVEYAITLREYLNYKDKSCKRYNTGYVVYFHDPYDMPHASIHSYMVKPNEILSLALKFDPITTPEELKWYPIQTRQCYFPDEPYLRYFYTYTENNCRLECFTNYTKQLCGCVAFYMPHDNTTRICSPYYIQCVDVAQILLYGNLQPRKINQFINNYFPSENNVNETIKLIERGKNFTDSCNCLPTCNTVNYNADVRIKDYDFEYYYDFYCTQMQICNDDNKTYKYSRIEWIFKHSSSMGMVRSSIFGVTDFIAQCGGLLGLFLGFSFLTIVEIFYYVTMRTGFLIRREKLSTKFQQENRY